MRLQAPFRYASTARIHRRWTNGEINARIAASSARSVAISLLCKTQGRIKLERVAEYMRDPELVPEGSRTARAGVPVDLPIVVNDGARLLIWDGHHRITAAMLRGEVTIRVRYVRL